MEAAHIFVSLFTKRQVEREAQFQILDKVQRAVLIIRLILRKKRRKNLWFSVDFRGNRS